MYVSSPPIGLSAETRVNLTNLSKKVRVSRLLTTIKASDAWLPSTVRLSTTRVRIITPLYAEQTYSPVLLKVRTKLLFSRPCTYRIDNHRVFYWELLRLDRLTNVKNTHVVDTLPEHQVLYVAVQNVGYFVENSHQQQKGSTISSD